MRNRCVERLAGAGRFRRCHPGGVSQLAGTMHAMDEQRQVVGLDPLAAGERDDRVEFPPERPKAGPGRGSSRPRQIAREHRRHQPSGGRGGRRKSIEREWGEGQCPGVGVLGERRQMGPALYAGAARASQAAIRFAEDDGG